ncbi:DUF5682 family protein [Actibacterium sp. 188UL27-1]|uniref:DUF5682 family protein n=1 Tax=Actibacterium sp. 188UL27-1 TaxID=2786961 RepID=UPI00195B26DF|nr:DUF5682 family protein [Actibacterium sp. 188UL27-1]MBM7065985.1 hypothetical protein [Actibacterium sp. 188UL27-1]
MPAPVTYLGIRHHGPGSARQVLAALEALQPAQVLIEGPADLTELMEPLGRPGIVPPVALLAYAAKAPEYASFWPFAEFSPEYQAIKWAFAHGAVPSFIDLPAATNLAEAELNAKVADALKDQDGDVLEEIDDTAVTLPEPATDAIARDPIGALAQAAGYEDGESWWSDVIEENPDPGEVFAAIATAMEALREGHIPDRREAQREAHMRRAIAKAARHTEGPIAVVCGAWHVPALRAKVKASDDTALLKGLPKTKVQATWAPWTSARLARATGYGAGIEAPLWYAHLWQHGVGQKADALWVARMAEVLRDEGFDASTASLIETVRLTRSLAAVRERPSPGFEEMRDAAISILMHGETLPWQIIETRLLLGRDVGQIPDNLPLAPLLDDLQRQQRKLQLKPEALERELSLDLRSERGLARSTLLHRLTALDVPWGQLTDPGRSRGTFREKWLLAWQPEFAVRLVEHLVYGPTIAAAAGGRMAEAIRRETKLSTLAETVRGALVAQLPDVAQTGTERLDALAAETDDCATLLAAIPPIVDTLRYGTAREMALDQMETLLDRLIIQSAVALPYAARNLDADAATALRDLIDATDQAIALSERAEPIRDAWIAALTDTGRSDKTTPLVGGLTMRLAYEVGTIAVEDLASLMSLRLSQSRPAIEAAGFFEGFFTGAGLKLVHDTDLRVAVDGWVMSLDEEAFTENLPLFRRVFSTLDRNERKVLLEHLLGRAGGNLTATFAPEAEALWAAQQATINRLFEGT